MFAGRLALGAALSFAMFAGLAVDNTASAKVSIKTNTKFYKITGRTARDFAQSMTKRGPYSRQHRARAWATAARDLDFQITHKIVKGNCRVQSARVNLRITYTMPKLVSKVSARERGKWKRMYGLLDRHEKVHGKLYRQLAHRADRALLRMKPAKSCRTLERNALKLVRKLSDADLRANDRFDARDKSNYRRMSRIYASG